MTKANDNENRGNVVDAMGGLLATLGITSVQKRDTIEEATQTHLTNRGIEAEVTSVRYNVVTLTADAANVRLFSYDKDHILESINNDLAPQKVENIIIKTKRNTTP